MATVVKMPQLGESLVEGTLLRWLKQPGEFVARQEPLATLSTDKIDTELLAPTDGILLTVAVPEGATVAVGSVVATIGAREAAPSEPPPAAERPSGRAFVSPVVARMAAEQAIDLEQVSGSGGEGRITRRDLERYLANRASHREAAARPTSPDAAEQLQPLSSLRRAIARHMVQSKQTSPHATTINEVDMSAVVRHREAQRQRGQGVTYTAYFAAATVAGLLAVPAANSRFSEEGIWLQRQIHLGVAVAVPAGLLVPVIRAAEQRSLSGLGQALHDLVSRARAGLLQPHEVQGGTFTLTNHGTGGSLLATPILHQPQSGILGVGAIVKRPVVRAAGRSLLPNADDSLAIRPMCYLSFTFDHRVMDGAEADRFLTAVKSQLENWPSRLDP